MVEVKGTEKPGGLYGRLLQRLALALDEADTAARLHDRQSVELELSGLSTAELELIRAYREGDLPWLRGWHAAAEELALIERQAQRSTRPGRQQGRGVHPPASRPGSLFKRRQLLCCALCGEAADIHPGQAVPACQACGSRLFRAGRVG